MERSPEMATTKTTTKTPTGTAGNGLENGAETGAAPLGTATGTDVRPAPGRIGGAVWHALNDHPGVTAATLAAAAGVSKATARRMLNDLEKAGYAARTPGKNVGGKRIADIWHAAPATTAGTDTDAGTPAAESVIEESPTTRQPGRSSDEAPDTTGDAAPENDTDATATTGEVDAPTTHGDGTSEHAAETPGGDGETASA